MLPRSPGALCGLRLHQTEKVSKKLTVAQTIEPRNLAISREINNLRYLAQDMLVSDVRQNTELRTFVNTHKGEKNG
jgi:hypothetical protein